MSHVRDLRRRVRSGAAAAALLLLPVVLGAQAPGDGQKPDIAVVAAAVRTQGMPCAQPQTVTADPEASSRLERAWILRCTEGAYRVKFLGDRGSKIERIE